MKTTLPSLQRDVRTTPPCPHLQPRTVARVQALWDCRRGLLIPNIFSTATSPGCCWLRLPRLFDPSTYRYCLYHLCAQNVPMVTPPRAAPPAYHESPSVVAVPERGADTFYTVTGTRARTHCQRRHRYRLLRHLTALYSAHAALPALGRRYNNIRSLVLADYM